MLTTLQIGGDAYAIGHQLGRFGAAAVHGLLRPSRAWRQVMARARDGDAVARLRGHAMTRFPHIMRELDGLAAGLELSPEEVFAWNCRGDLAVEAGDGCTTLMAACDGHALIAHNEDGYPVLAGHCAIAQVSMDGRSDFTAFVYPGSLPGHTFAVNQHGLAFAVNNIRSTSVLDGVPRQIVARALLDASDLDAALAVLNGTARAGGFHHVIGQAGDARLLSVEATDAGVATTVIERPAAHANHLVDPRLARVRQHITASSRSRQARGDALAAGLPPLPSASQALAFLRNADDAQLPIHRCAADDPDEENTLASALLRIEPDAVHWRFYAGSGLSPIHQGSILSSLV